MANATADTATENKSEAAKTMASSNSAEERSQAASNLSNSRSSEQKSEAGKKGGSNSGNNT